jgi:SAM-dependent methyltransferase
VDLKAQLQEEQYAFPYHYLPQERPKRFSQVEYWSWGYRYLGRLRIAEELLEQLKFDSLVDIGCGDGRFLHDVSTRYPEKRLVGVDSSQTAIRWARCLNPELIFEAQDILTKPLQATYDVATLLDVIEHIHPDQLNDFVEAALGAVRPGGWLILTAPHTNMKLDAKHYQHFNPEHLDRLLEGKTASRRYTFFDGKRWPVSLLLKLMGGSGRHFIVTSRLAANLLYYSHRTWCLRDSHPRRCQRLACLAQKSSEPADATKSA